MFNRKRVLGVVALALVASVTWTTLGAFEPLYTTVTTPPVRGQVFACRLLNVGQSPLTNQTMKFFNALGSEIDANLVSESCQGPVWPGRFCTATFDTGGGRDATVYCQLSYFSNGDNGRGSMQVMALDVPGLVVEAR